MSVDVALLVPFEPDETAWLDPVRRRKSTPALFSAVRARHRLEEAVGAPLDDVLRRAQSAPDGRSGFRSASAVTLASCLERAGLSWHVVDPGPRRLSFWRAKLRELASLSPRLVAINSTFIVEVTFLRALSALVRRELPKARLALGGYLYATSSEAFLGLDADIFCIGDGEQRIVAVTRAVRYGHDLAAIKGLYLRGSDGRLTFTGAPEPVPIETLPVPDWSVSLRIDPPVDATRVALDHIVETQRGCVFKCAFCTFRTLAPLQMTSVERAVELLLAPAPFRVSKIEVADATASYPRDRYRAILEQLSARGGSPHPVKVMVRVSDLDDEVCALMARANVRLVFVGQESGDQRLLNGMRKGTRVEHVRPAVSAMGKHGIRAIFGFIHGFPGEDEASLAATRAMLLSLNDDSGELPTVLCTAIEPFMAQDFASVSQREELADVAHPYDYRGPGLMSPERATLEVLRTQVMLSRNPRAPVTCFAVHRAFWALPEIADDALRLAAFRWLKAFDRGLGVFVAHEVFGEALDRGALRGAVQELRDSPWGRLEAPSGLYGGLSRLRHRVIWRLASEWRNEATRGLGPLTRLLVAASLLNGTASPRFAWRGFTHGDLGDAGWSRGASPAAALERERMAGDLIQLGIQTGRGRLKRAS